MEAADRLEVEARPDLRGGCSDTGGMASVPSDLFFNPKNWDGTAAVPPEQVVLLRTLASLVS